MYDKNKIELKKMHENIWNVLSNLTISSSLLKKPIDIYIPRDNMLTDIN